MTEGVVLSVNDLSVNFGGLKALNGVNFELRKGEVLGLIGLMVLEKLLSLMRFAELSLQIQDLFL